MKKHLYQIDNKKGTVIPVIAKDIYECAELLVKNKYCMGQEEGLRIARTAEILDLLDGEYTPRVLVYRNKSARKLR